MKIVINRCYGGYGLSPKALNRLAELQGRECYFYQLHSTDRHRHRLVSMEQIGKETFLYFAYDIPNVDDALPSQGEWRHMSDEERKANNALWDKHSIDDFRQDRTNPLLVRVVEELGDEANGWAAKLKIVEIPDATEYEIEEYDGLESVHEMHQVWR